MPKLRWISRNIEEIMGSALVGVIVLSSSIEVISRNLHMPVMWTNELSRYAFIWAVFIGAVVLVKRQGHITVSFLSTVVPAAVEKVLFTVIQLSLIILFAVLTKYGLNLALEMWSVPTTSLEWSTGLVYAILPISCVLMAVYTAMHLWRGLAGKQNSRDLISTANQGEE